MGWWDKLLGRKEAAVTQPPAAVADAPPAAEVSKGPAPDPFAGLEGIRFGRYGDNNKTIAQLQQMAEAEDLYRSGAYAASFAAFFDYLSDPAEGNVQFRPDGSRFTFQLVQGSCMIYGDCDGECITARTCLATMDVPAKAVMRRLLDLNFSLYYSRCGLSDSRTLCMLFDSNVTSSPPQKLYNGLRELATKADRHDDLLLVDFPSLKPADTGHIRPLPEEELEVKYTWFRKWISEGLDRISGLNPDSFSGAIAYYLLAILYRIDFLLQPEAALQADLERIHNTYWEKKDELTLVERNGMMKEDLRGLLRRTREEFAAGVYRSKSTFSPLPLPKMDKVRDNISGANRDAAANMEKKYPDLAVVLNEYGVMYNHFLYNMPQVLTELATVYMGVMHAPFFQALGQHTPFYDAETKTFNQDLIKAAVDTVIGRHGAKYVSLSWDHQRIKWDSLYEFGKSFSETMSGVKLETKKLHG